MAFSAQTRAATQGAALEQLNLMGSSGYCFVTDGTAVSLLNTQSFSLYYLDPAATSAPALQYAIAPAAKLVSDWVVQANSLGSLGYNYKGAFSVGGVAGDMFVKYATTTDVFIYRGVGISIGSTVDQFLEQLNASGSSGYRWAGPMSIASGGVHIFETKLGSTEKFTYAAEGVASDFSTRMAILNRYGSQGAQSLGIYSIGGKSYEVFETRTGQTGAISYTAEQVAATESTADVQTAVNAQAANGWLYWDTTTVVINQVSQRVRIYSQGETYRVNPTYGVWLP